MSGDTTGKRARRPTVARKKGSTANKEPPPSRKRSAPRGRAGSDYDDDEFDRNEDDEYVEEELRPGNVYIGKKAVETRNVGLSQPLPHTTEGRIQALDLPDPVFIYQWTNYFNTVLVGTPSDYNLQMNAFRQSIMESYSEHDQEFVARNLGHLEAIIGQVLGVGRRFGLLGAPMRELTMEPVEGHMNPDGSPVWVPDIPDHEVLAGLVYAMADGSGIVDMDSTKPWKHWQKMRLVDFATVAERVMHCLKRQYAGYPQNHRINNFTFTERYNMILDLMRTCKGSVVRMHRPSTLEELLLNPKKMKQRFLDNQVNNLKKKMDANDLRILRAKEKVIEWDKERLAAIEAGEPEPPMPESPIFRTAYSEWLIEKNKIAAGILPEGGDSGLADLPNDDFSVDLDDEDDSDNPFSDSDEEDGGRRKRRKKSANSKPLTLAQRATRSRIAEARRRNVPLRRIPKEKAPIHKAPLSNNDLKGLGWNTRPELLNALHLKENEVNHHWDEILRRDANPPQVPVVRELADGRLIGEIQYQQQQQQLPQVQYQQGMNQFQAPQQQQQMGFTDWHNLPPTPETPGQHLHHHQQQQQQQGITYPMLQHQQQSYTFNPHDHTLHQPPPPPQSLQHRRSFSSSELQGARLQINTKIPLPSNQPDAMNTPAATGLIFPSPVSLIDPESGNGMDFDNDMTGGQFEAAWAEMQNVRDADGGEQSEGAGDEL